MFTRERELRVDVDKRWRRQICPVIDAKRGLMVKRHRCKAWPYVEAGPGSGSGEEEKGEEEKEEEEEGEEDEDEEEEEEEKDSFKRK